MSKAGGERGLRPQFARSPRGIDRALAYRRSVPAKTSELSAQVPTGVRASSTASLTAVTYVFAAVMMGTTLPTPLYPDFELQYGFGSLTTTLLFSVYAGGVIVALIVFGQVSRRLGRRPVLVTGLVFSLLSTLIFLFAGPLWILYVARIISGLSAGIFTAVGTVSVIEHAPEARKNTASALATAANIGGLGLGILLAGIVAQVTPWPLQAPFVVHALLLVVAGLALLLVRETVVPDRSHPFLKSQRVPRQTRPIFVAASIGVFAGFAVCGIYSSIAPGFITEVLDITGEGAVGSTIASVFLASAAAQILLRPMSDRWLVVSGAVALIVGMALLVVSLLEASLAILVASSLLAGAGQGVLFMAGMRAILERADAEDHTHVATSYFLVAYLAISIPSIAAGLVSTFMDLRITGIVAAMAIGVVTGAAVLFAKRFSTH